MKRRLCAQSGATIIEVLIASVVFLTGFSLLVSFLSKTVDRVSFEDLYLAASVAEQQMELIERYDVSKNADTTIFQGNHRFTVSRSIVTKDNKKSVSITVKRPSSRKILIELYNEFPQNTH